LGAIDKEEMVAEVISVIETGNSEREALGKVSEKYNITDKRTRAVIHSIVFEIGRRLNLIDLLINETLEKGNISKLYPLLRNLIRYGVYNLKFTDKSPHKITKFVVEKTKKHFGKSISKFSNALLRKIETIDISNYISNYSGTEQLSLRYYHPKWFINYLIKLLGRTNAIEFLKKSLEPNNVYVRINSLKTDPITVSKKLEEEGYEFILDEDLSDVVKIIKWKYPIVRSRIYKEGLIYIQDKASALVSHIINPQDEQVIFDVCAAPGGKSMHVGQLLENKGRVFAIDRSSRRLLELTSKLSIHGFQNIHVLNAVGEKVTDFLRIKADKIVVDPPCSGTGTFISRPFSKWKLKQKDLDILIKIQWKLLVSVVKAIKDKGEIVYSTCSITLEENEQIIQRFLKEFPEFALTPMKPFIGVPGYLGLTETQRLFPHLHDTEGFFIAKLKKK